MCEDHGDEDTPSSDADAPRSDDRTDSPPG
jgi:hypothetical protein